MCHRALAAKTTTYEEYIAAVLDYNASVSDPNDLVVAMTRKHFDIWKHFEFFRGQEPGTLSRDESAQGGVLGGKGLGGGEEGVGCGWEMSLVSA